MSGDQSRREPKCWRATLRLLGSLGFLSLSVVACSDSEQEIDQQVGFSVGAVPVEPEPSSGDSEFADRVGATDVGVATEDVGDATQTSMRIGVLEEELRIDGATEDLVAIGEVGVSADGTMAFVQRQDSRILVYDAAGNRVGAFGRQGEGPGEFRAPSAVGWFGDTLWVSDGLQNRLTLISPTLQLVGTHPTNRAGFTQVLGVGSSGWFVGRISQASPVGSVIGRVESNQSEWTPLMALPPEEDAQIRFSGGTLSLPFGNLPQSASSANGERVAIAMATRDGPNAETFLLTVASSRGDTIFSKRYPFEGEPITREVGQRLLEERIALLQQMSSRGGTVNESAISDMRRARIPPFFSPLRRLLVGNDFSTWVELRMRGDELPYFVVDAEGNPIGSIVLHPRSRIVAASLTNVWLVTTDDLGIESLVRYSVEWN